MQLQSAYLHLSLSIDAIVIIFKVLLDSNSFSHNILKCLLYIIFRSTEFLDDMTSNWRLGTANLKH
jgi:hypothetical protein